MADPTHEPHHTVAIWLPGTETRVLVTKLSGTPREAIEMARALLQKFAYEPPSRWLHKVVATDVVTDVTPPDSQQEKTP